VGAETDVSEYFKKLHPWILVDIILTKPKIEIIRTQNNTGYDAVYTCDNLINL